MAFASGKAILVGEHAVVYGVDALAVGLDDGVRATSSRDKSRRLVLGAQTCAPGAEEFVAYEAILDELGGDRVATVVSSSLPHGVGLGASAAIGVAIARAVLELQEPTSSPLDPRVLKSAHLWENVFHGRASGLDAACAFQGGCIRYRPGLVPERVSVGGAFDLCIAVAAPAPSTKAMVAQVARTRSLAPAAFEKHLDRFRAVTRRAEGALGLGDLEALGQELNRCHELLASWDLSVAEVEQACQTARDAGALGAKLTGGGGGGCVLALSGPGGADPILAAWRAQALRCFVKRVDGRK